jgi:hypothetical protein
LAGGEIGLCYGDAGALGDMKAITCIEDLRQLAHRKVPLVFMDYIEGGSIR